MARELPLVALGVNHHTAPVDVRERLAMDEDGVRRHLSVLRGKGIAAEALLLSTCNRVELYAVPGDAGPGGILDWFRTFRGPRGEDLGPFVFQHQGREAVRHLFRVASSLDSLVVGEPQILGQVKDAVRVAEENAAMGRVLSELSRRTLQVAKRVRTETDIGKYRVGVGNAGVDLATQIFGDLTGRRALLLGVGEMGTQVAHALQSAGLEELLVANRTYERAVETAQEHKGTPLSWDRVEEYLAWVDIVIAATGATTPIITQAMVRAGLKKRRYKPLFLVDLSVPRNIEPRVDQLEGAYLFNVDDLKQVVEQGLAAREQARVAAEQVVADETEKFVTGFVKVEVGPRIGALTRQMEDTRVAELARSQRLVESLTEDQRLALEALTKALVKKALHKPIQAIHAAAKAGDEDRLAHLLAVWEEEP
jgi:glutamyl-tRNA reductase